MPPFKNTEEIKAFDKLGGVRLRIVTPLEFAQQFDYKHATGSIEAHLANFGWIQFGTAISANSYHPITQQDACNNLSEEREVAQGVDLEHDGFVIVDAGGCSYETKARNIQDMGAKVAIIIENDNEMSELKSDNVENFIRGKTPPYDGTGSSVYIPTLLINKDDGEKIKQLFHDDPAVQL